MKDIIYDLASDFIYSSKRFSELSAVILLTIKIWNALVSSPPEQQSKSICLIKREQDVIHLEKTFPNIIELLIERKLQEYPNHQYPIKQISHLYNKYKLLEC